jgi:heat shock protein HtpX
MRKTIPQQIAANRRASLFYMFGLVVVLAGLVSAIYGIYAPKTWYYGTVIAAVLGIVAGMIAFYSGSDIILSISHARPANQQEDQVLNNVVEEMAIAAGIPKPKIYVIDDPSPNAFATGRDPQHAVVCFTTGILSKLDRDELQGVAAHELSHVRNYDTRFMTTVTILAGMIPLIADGFRRSLWWGGGRRSNSRDNDGAGIFMIIAIVLSILAPIFAYLLQMAISRQREFLADASGAELTRYPEALARALQKIESDPEPLQVANRATQGMYIINPLSAQGLSNLMSTHPSTQARIAALMGLAGNYHHGPAIDNPMGTQAFQDMPDVADQTLHEPPPRLSQ